MDIFENDLRLFRNDLEELKQFRKRRTKLYRIKKNPMEEIDETEFRRKYKFSKENMRKIIDLLKIDLEVDPRGGSIPVDIQVMAAIRYWAGDENQAACSDIHGISQQALSKLSRKTAMALASKASQFIKMPTTIEEQQITINKFKAICGFPQVIGAIDSTDIRTMKLGDIKEKGVHYVNIQVICDTSLKICDIVCEWKESRHDGMISEESRIKQRLESNEFHGRLLGDSVYRCTPFLFTPILKPQTEAEHRYNMSHTQTRNVIKRCFVLWKERFRILQGIIRGSFTTINSTIIACAVLHNLAIELNEIDNAEESVSINEEDFNEEIHMHSEEFHEIIHIQNEEDFHNYCQTQLRDENNTREVFINKYFN